MWEVELRLVAISERVEEDEARRYDLCGGAQLFPGELFPSRIVGPREVRPANPVIVGETFPGDRSKSWFVVVQEDSRPLVVVDLAPSRLGRCYDADHEVYGVAGSMSVVAETFADLLARLVDGRGGHWYWLEPGWRSIGDAYD